MPITRDAILQVEAIEVMEREEVFVAKTQSAETISSNSVKSAFFISMFSTMASTMSPQFFKEDMFSENVIFTLFSKFS